MPNIHHLTLTVSDVERSARWYQELLGNALVVERATSEWRRVRMAWPDGLVIGVTQFEGSTPERFSHLRVGLDHVGLACASQDEVGAWVQSMDRLGIEHGPLEDAPYGWAVTARDPDNIPVEFFCPVH